jgi:uncharacterized membrane protein
MPFCAQCGSPVTGRFCASCGAAQPGGAASTPLPENTAAALCYALWALTGVLFLVLEPYHRSREVRFHAYQSIFTFVALFAGFAVLNVLAAIPFLGWLFWAATLLFPLLAFGLWVVLMYRAYTGQRWMLPVVGELAAKRA